MIFLTKKNICIDDINIKNNKHTTLIQRDKGFLTIGNTIIGEGVGNVKSILIHGLNNKDHPLAYDEGEVNKEELNKEKNEYISAILKYNGLDNDAVAILSPLDLGKFVDVTVGDVTVLALAHQQKQLFLSVLVFVNGELDQKTLVKLFKSIIDAKLAAMWDVGVINHFSFDPLTLEDNESILLACKGQGVTAQNTDELNQDLQNCVRKAVENALKRVGFPKGVLGYMNDVGVGVDDLVDAGMELVVGVDESPDMRIKLKKQILHSLNDLNVVSFIIAGIRLEEDYEKHRVLGVDVDDDPAYLYSDEVFGMSVANQIAGTKAIFNFKRYDEAKPGIISKLGPVLDDVFAGLVAGCMSKIFEV